MADMTVEAGIDERTGRRRWEWPAVGVALIGLLAFGWWYAHSAEAFDLTGGPTASVNVTTAGTAYSVVVAQGKQPSVTVTNSRVILGDGSGPAAVGAVVCDLGSVGVTAGPLTPFATGCRDLTDTELGGIPDTAQIIITVVPLENQAVEVTGLGIEFHDGWRQGSQTLPINFTVAAPT
jgi:hypothetical protein